MMKRFGSFDVTSLARDSVAGSIAGIVQIAYCISFSALIFQGPLASGFSLGLAALLMGTIVTGFIVAATTSLKPADAGPDTPAVAVMSVLAGTLTATLAGKGLSQEALIVNVLMALSVSTLFTGVLLFGLGALRLSEWLRFIPYPVVGGFLAASGWLLMTGGIEVISGSNLTLSPSSWSALLAPGLVPQLSVALAFGLSILFLRQWVDSYLALPIVFVVYLAGLGTVLYFWPHLDGGDWFLGSIGSLRPWWPVPALLRTDIDWLAMAQSSAEIGAVCGVTAISMLLDVSSLEVARQKSADLDKELRVNGIANLFAAAFGGVAGNLSLNGSILINEAGAATRLSGFFVAGVCALVLFAGFDVGSVVPKAVLGGMLAYLGVVILIEALLHAPAKRSRTDFALTALIMFVICYFGYLVGVVLGVIGACLMFALNYSRVGVVRRHLTRREFAGNVERSPEQSRLLREAGGGIHLFWLSGFIFFGSSNGLFERIRRTIDEKPHGPVRFVLLDFSAVSGLDTSAVLSLVKLRNYCREHHAALVFAGLDAATLGNMERSGFFEDEAMQRAFGSRNEALEWCEDCLLRLSAFEAASDRSFESWLRAEFGEIGDLNRIAPYLERSELPRGAVLFAQGDASDCIAMIAEGSVAITIDDERGRPIRLRRMASQTVVGEMGFYRNLPRTANVIAEEKTVVYSLSRESFDKMRNEDAAAAAAFHELIVRLLADRLDFANREISALL